ncbi:hypothetical protein [Aestuariivita boseongensis]|uniref:hypothetical protein n=1 Tax=Aestuariivita boseongensis TaxID=1470562 RepID=UPI000680E1FC|nr:hypothetical protein [Aestuariivita boseongensis]
MEQASQRALLCPACGGQCVFDPAQQMLSCESCGAAHAIAVDASYDPAEEFHYHPDTPHTEQPVLTRDRIHQCETCGGEVIFTGPALSDRCAYCDGPVVLRPGDESFLTMGLIPFRLTADQAQARALDWVNRRIAAPGDLTDIVAQGRVAGLYAPFFTFDSHEVVDYWASYRTGSGKNARTRKTRGRIKIAFDDLLAPASPHVTPMIRDGILHDFHPRDLRPYQPAFLSGFAAERHHLSVPEGLEANASDKDLLIRNRIRTHVNKNRIVDIGYKTHTSGIHYRRILLPVWILHYHYGESAMKVVVCGLRGRTFGERPFSKLKLAAYSATLSALAIVTGWLWGAAGLL